VKFTTTLPAPAIEQLRELGRGSAAAGILVLLERYKAAPGGPSKETADGHVIIG